MSDLTLKKSARLQEMTSGLSASVEESKLKTNEYVLKIQEQKNKEKAEKHPMNYGVPNFGMDHEIATSLKNL